MKKYLLLLLIALGSFVNVQAQKFALIDMEYIMRNIPAYERAGEQLNQISKKWQAEVEALDNEAKTLYRNYQNEAVFLSEAQKKDREDKIVKKEKGRRRSQEKVFRTRRRTLQKAYGSPPTHPRRGVQCGENCGASQRIPTYPRQSQRRSGDHLCLSCHRHQQ